MKEPVIQKFDFAAMPVISLAVRSQTMPPRELTELADRKVKRRAREHPRASRRRSWSGRRSAR